MLSELSKIGLSAEAIYCLESDDHKEYLQRKAEVKSAKCKDQPNSFRDLAYSKVLLEFFLESIG